jgi:hypothetical protein
MSEPQNAATDRTHNLHQGEIARSCAQRVLEPPSAPIRGGDDAHAVTDGVRADTEASRAADREAPLPVVRANAPTPLPVVRAELVRVPRPATPSAPTPAGSSPSASALLPLSAHQRYDRRVACLLDLLEVYFTVTPRPGDLSAKRSRGGWLITWVKDDEERRVLQSFHKCLLSIAERISRFEDTR